MTRFKSWQWMTTRKCHGKYVRNVCIPGIRDLPNLAKRKELFANKIFLDYQPLVLDCLEELILNRTRDGYLGRRTFDASFYSELDFVKKHF